MLLDLTSVYIDNRRNSQEQGLESSTAMRLRSHDVKSMITVTIGTGMVNMGALLQ